MSKNVKKVVKHVFTEPERREMGNDLARAHGSVKQIETEFEGVKASYKAKISEKESAIETLSTNLVNGFTMKEKECRVVFDVPQSKKRFYAAESAENTEVLAEEAMTQDDFQKELIEAESVFGKRKEIELFASIDQDRGVLVVGQLKDRWYSALRISIGKKKLEERLDSEQKSFKQRYAAIKAAVSRSEEWLAASFGKESAKGFMDGLAAILDAEKDKEE